MAQDAAVSASGITPPTPPNAEVNAWWTTLRHEGVLVSPLVLEAALPHGPAPIPTWMVDRLRAAYTRFLNDPRILGDWLDMVLEYILQHTRNQWRKGPQVPKRYRNERRRAKRVLLMNSGSEEGAQLLVYVDQNRVVTDDGEPQRLGIHRGRKEYAEFVRLLQDTGVSVGLLTNGHQFRLIHTTMDQARWTEWDAAAWFEGGEGRSALHGFVGLLGIEALPTKVEPKQTPLYQWIQQSRERQADLSYVMGTQVRGAVEALLQELDDVLSQAKEEEKASILQPIRKLNLRSEEELRARYQAAIRIVMRLVVALYAESRELFPKSNPIYYDSYSIDGLFHILRRAHSAEGEEVLRAQFSAWPRLQALFRLIHGGSSHPDLTLTAYDGELFRPPVADEKDEVAAALAVLEHPFIRISDATVLIMLKGLKVGKFKAGRVWQTGPVDFSDLRTEYIGMMYEGLLDYDLRMAREEDGGIVVFNLGDQPALPFQVLQHVVADKKRIKKLIENLKKKTKSKIAIEEEGSETEEDEKEYAGDADVREEETTSESLDEELQKDDVDVFEHQVHEWAVRAVEATGIFLPSMRVVKKWDPTRRVEEVDKAARRLVLRVIPPGSTYLVRWSGTRKGTGTFYTKPSLAFPMVHRTLEPLVYESGPDGTKVPKPPEEILRLKVCDPAMGSASFLVAAVGYLTRALKESFDVHVLSQLDRGQPVTELGHRAQGLLNEHILPILRGEEEVDMDARMEAQLKRAVVEHCIYGVDINPLAVELGKLSLWIETMDPHLPFTFLDHKIRCGNSLVGAWLHEYMHYPVASWLREAGDGRSGPRTKRIKKILKEQIKPQIVIHLTRALHDTSWFGTRPSPVDLTTYARTVFEKLHRAIDEVDRERIFREELQSNPNLAVLRHLMNRWCAIWFWPMDEEVPVLNPDVFYGGVKDEATDPIVLRLANNHRLRFFHWELEFPDVFTPERWGFDAVFGNPPWETYKPNALEFFTRFRPEFRTYGKRESPRIQDEIFKAEPVIEEEWVEYKEHFRGFSNYVKNAAQPFDVALARAKKGKELKASWNRIRNNLQPSSHDAASPYRYQGSGDVNTYKLFVENFYHLVHANGRFAVLSPAGIYADYGTQSFRRLFLEQNKWEWIYSFENRKRIFDIHSGYKFCVSILQKGGRTEEIRCRFMVHDLDDWAQKGIPQHVQVTREKITQFSPENLGIVEVQHPRDLEILEKIYRNSVFIKDLGIKYRQEFHMTNDSDKFRPKEWFIERGIIIAADGIVRNELEIVAFPLIEGRHIDHFDFQASAHLKGKGRSAKWETLEWPNKYLGPNFLVPVENLPDDMADGLRIGLMSVTSSSNERTLRATVLPRYPTGNSIGILKLPDGKVEETLQIVVVLCSYACDFVIRNKLTGLNANWYLLKELPIPKFQSSVRAELLNISSKLALAGEGFDPQYEKYIKNVVTDPGERVKLQETLDRLVAQAYGLTDEDMRWILRPDNLDPRNLWRDYKERLKLLGGKGNWGELPEEEKDA